MRRRSEMRCPLHGEGDSTTLQLRYIQAQRVFGVSVAETNLLLVNSEHWKLKMFFFEVIGRMSSGFRILAVNLRRNYEMIAGGRKL